MPDELDLLKELGREQSEPDESSVSRARDRLEHRIGGVDVRIDEMQASANSRGRRRWVLAVAVAALLVGSGLGFGIGSSVTPSGSAGANVAGLGFIPADGWRVTQTASIGESGVARAVASTVPLEAGDEARDVPVATLKKLPAKGIVIVARFFPRGDPLWDARFPLRTLPLHVADAVPGDLPRRLSQTPLVPLRLRAAAGGYNVDARVFVGGALTPTLLASVDEQLRRLVVAPRRVTLVVQPTIVVTGDQRMTIFGSVDSGKAGEKVTIQFKACGLLPIRFRDAFETTTDAGGGFSLNELRPFNLGVSGVYRAVSGDDISPEVVVRQRAHVSLRPVGGGRFEVRVGGKLSFWRRFVLLQRFERARGVWITLRRVVLTEGHGSSLPLRPRVTKGTRIRAVLPLSQARPCYLAGVSEERRA